LKKNTKTILALKVVDVAVCRQCAKRRYNTAQYNSQIDNLCMEMFIST